jgi:polyferredoxin
LRRTLQSFLWLVVAVTIIGGYWFPLLGFTVPVVMLAGVVGGFVRGRYVCGWLCPRGAFFDRIMKPVSPSRAIPAWLRSPALRWPVFGAMMGFMVFQIMQNPGDLYHWGTVFWRICLITTGLGVVLALVVHPRGWCAFCPMGTMQEAIGGRKAPLYLAQGCKGCRSCERACPMGLSIIGERASGPLSVRDCVKCPECQVACPQGILRL